MRYDPQIWAFALERVTIGDDVFLLLVGDSRGSSPGRRGFKMVVALDGFVGSIGGGVMEVRLAEEARDLLLEKNASGKTDDDREVRFNAVIRQVHRENSDESSGMICSGEQIVIRRLLSAADSNTLEALSNSRRSSGGGALRLTESRFLVEDGEQGTPGIFFERTEKGRFTYREPLGSLNRLYIVGGGHCALALSEVMSRLDFDISLFDDRPDLGTFEKNEFVDEKKLLGSYEEIGELIPSGENTFVVVMTIGYKFDDLVIRRLLEKDFRYFGVLGSDAKMTVLLRELREEGYAEDRIERIETPIGLRIGSRSPEEIAVSIAAQIISYRNAGP